MKNLLKSSLFYFSISSLVLTGSNCPRRPDKLKSSRLKPFYRDQSKTPAQLPDGSIKAKATPSDSSDLPKNDRSNDDLVSYSKPVSAAAVIPPVAVQAGTKQQKEGQDEQGQDDLL
ncbi:hypothetical protein [Cardinium endosymbiont of Nabis limbatus]|uniref:hypothetical protein n=1 Tax=Cardinium endosymbiont of Nabis limbatus TaxID=3066217 RepID=UPI003AF3986E